MQAVASKTKREQGAETRRRVAELRGAGKTYRQIGEELGISVQRVWQVLKAIEAEAPPTSDAPAGTGASGAGSDPRTQSTGA